MFLAGVGNLARFVAKFRRRCMRPFLNKHPTPKLDTPLLYYRFFQPAAGVNIPLRIRHHAHHGLWVNPYIRLSIWTSAVSCLSHRDTPCEVLQNISILQLTGWFSVFSLARSCSNLLLLQAYFTFWQTHGAIFGVCRCMRRRRCNFFFQPNSLFHYFQYIGKESQ